MKYNIREYQSPHMHVVRFDVADIVASSPVEGDGDGIYGGIRNGEFGTGLRF